MIKFNRLSVEKTALIIAIYQIIGGVVGLGVILFALFRIAEINGPTLAIFLIVIGLFLLSIKSGSLILKKDYKKGIIYSFINQFLQIFAFGLGNNWFSYIAGAKLKIGFYFTNGFQTSIDFGLTSDFNMGINSTSKEYFIYINLVAVFVFLVLNDIYKVKFGKKEELDIIPETSDRNKEINFEK